MTDPAPTAIPPLIDLTVEVHLSPEAWDLPAYAAGFVLVANGRRWNGWHVDRDNTTVTLIQDNVCAGTRVLGRLRVARLAPGVFDGLLALAEDWQDGSPLMCLAALEKVAASGMVRGEHVEHLESLIGGLAEQTVLS